MATLTCFVILVALVLSCVSLSVDRAAYRVRKAHSLATNQKCKPPKSISRNGVFSIIDGWLRLGKMISVLNDGRDILDDFLRPAFGDAHTIQETSFDGSSVITTIEPENMRAILATQFKEFEIGQLRINQFLPLLGNSIFSSDGSCWERSRKLLRPFFNRECIANLDHTEQACKGLIQCLRPRESYEWTAPTNLHSMFSKLTLDTATGFLFGESIKTLSTGTKSSTQGTRPLARVQAQSRQFLDDFELVSMYLLKRIRYQSFYWLADGAEFRLATARIRGFADRYVEDELQARRHAPVAKSNVLSALVDETQDRRELCDQTMAILAAARDTTAGLLCWSFVRLALHPNVLSKLRATLQNDFSPSTPITSGRLLSCRYLQQFLNEVLRLHPIVPVNNRRARVDTTLPAGGGPDGKAPVAIAKGQVVIYSIYLMHRRKDLWGEDAETFKPERWENRVPLWQFLPFSGGPRTCLGQQFALAEVSLVLVRMLETFDRIEAVDQKEMKQMRKCLGLTMWPADGVKVRLRRA